MPLPPTQNRRQALYAGPEYNTDWSSVVRGIRQVQANLDEIREWSRWKEDQFRREAGKGKWVDRLQELMIHPLGTGTDSKTMWRWLSFNDEQGYTELVDVKRRLVRKLGQLGQEVMNASGTGDYSGVFAQSRFVKPHLDEVEKVFNRFLSRVYPAKFSYKGFKITNPHRMSEPLVQECRDGIAAMLAVFKKRGVDQMLINQVREIMLVPSVSAKEFNLAIKEPHGVYQPSRNRIVMSGDAIRSGGVGRFMKNWVHEVFLHEFGHHVHLTGMTDEARSFWNEGWAEVWKAENAARERKSEKQTEYAVIEQKDIQRFWKTFKATGYKASQAADQFSGVTFQKFWVWLQRAGFVNKRLNLTKQGKQRTTFLRRYPEDKQEWAKRYEQERRSLFHDYRDYYDEGLEQYEFEYEDILQALRVKDGMVDYAKDIYLQPEEIELVKSSDLDQLKVDSSVERRKDDLGIPSGYGRINPKEDFAETFVQWMVNPRKLSSVAQWRMGRAMWLSGYGGKPIMRLSMARRIASAHQYGIRDIGESLLGRLYEMPLSKDTFVHFTTPDRAEAIVESGKLLMRPPHPKFGTDTVNAVSTTYGVWQPGVQTTHLSRRDLVAVLFQTDTVPKYGYVEEVVWDRDVKLRNPRIVSFQKATGMLKRAPVRIDDGDKVVYR